jgi:hypothetical protein
MLTRDLSCLDAKKFPKLIKKESEDNYENQEEEEEDEMVKNWKHDSDITLFIEEMNELP